MIWSAYDFISYVLTNTKVKNVSDQNIEIVERCGVHFNTYLVRPC